jgi:hypothetical protein
MGSDMNGMGGREFNSELELEVWVQELPVGNWVEWELLGRTPAVEPLVIPAGRAWRVQPVGGTTVAQVVREVRDRGIAGLRLGEEVGCVDLAQLRELTDLEMLDLSFAQVTDAGLVHLRELKKLKVLELSFTSVTDAGLVQLKGCKSLQTLELCGTAVTDVGLAQLTD